MLYFLYEDKSLKKVVIYETSKKYLDVKIELEIKQGYKIIGCFGRKDYAEHWLKYHNGQISLKEHKKFLDIYP